jgi:ABC-type sugar transport system ATPase subunit
MNAIQREQKATKADDTEVPEFLWVSHLVDNSPSEWSVGQQDNLEVVRP